MAKLAEKISGVLFADAVAFVLLIATGIILARGLGAAERGRYALCFSAVSMMAALFTGGLNVASTYFIASNKLRAKQVVGLNVLWALISAVLVLALFPLFVSAVGSTVLKGLSDDLLLLIGIMVPVLIANNLVVAIVLGLHDYFARNVMHVLRQLLRGGFITVALLALAGRTREAMIASILSLGIATILGCWFIATGAGISFDLPWQKVKSIAGYSCKIYPAALAGLVFGHISVFFINAFDIPKDELGAYAVAASSMLPLIYFLPNAISSVIFPELSSLSNEERAHIAPLICRCTLLITIPLCTVLAILAKPLVLLVFGSEYALTPVLFCFLLPGALLACINRVCAQMLNASGHPGYSSIVSTTTVMVLCLFDFLLIPNMGAKGAALAFSLTGGYGSFLYLLLCRRANVAKISDMIVVRVDDIKLLWRTGKKALARFKTDQTA